MFGFHVLTDGFWFHLYLLYLLSLFWTFIRSGFWLSAVLHFSLNATKWLVEYWRSKFDVFCIYCTCLRSEIRDQDLNARLALSIRRSWTTDFSCVLGKGHNLRVVRSWYWQVKWWWVIKPTWTAAWIEHDKARNNARIGSWDYKTILVFPCAEFQNMCA